MLLRLSRSLSMFVCLIPYPILFYRASQRNRSWVASLLCGVTCGLSTGNAGTSPTGSGCLVHQLPTGCMTENTTRCSWTPWQDWWASLCRGFVQNCWCTKVSLVPSPYSLCSCCCTAAVEKYCSSHKCREDGGWINVNLYRSTATLVLYCLCGLERVFACLITFMPVHRSYSSSASQQVHAVASGDLPFFLPLTLPTQVWPRGVVAAGRFWHYIADLQQDELTRRVDHQNGVRCL